MKKILLALVIILNTGLTACTSKEGEARRQIADRMDALIKSPKLSSYVINDCLYATKNDSCYIFNGYIIKNRPYSVEYFFQQYEDNILIGVKDIESSGSLLRNITITAEPEGELDNALYKAWSTSGYGLAITILNDLKDGSLIDITDAI